MTRRKFFSLFRELRAGRRWNTRSRSVKILVGYAVIHVPYPGNPRFRGRCTAGRIRGWPP